MAAQSGPDDRTQDELLRDLQYGSPEEQEETLMRLAAVGEAELLDAVVDYLRDQPPVDMGRRALESLRVLANKYLPVDRYRLAEVLIPFLSSDSWEQRLIAVRLMNTYPNELSIEATRDLIEDAREKVATEQQRRFSPARILAERTLGEAIMSLANAGRLLVLPDILDMLEDPALRIVATRALGIIGSETERLHLEDLIEDPDPRVRDAAQWGLGLMDERAEQFLNPPTEIPEPPPDRLHPLYWAHRQLYAADNDLIQFMVVRVAIEHLMLDLFLGDGRVPETCTIQMRRYQGDTPPQALSDETEIIGVWEYTWQGPTLRRLDVTAASPARPPRPGEPSSRRASITITCPETLPYEEDGLVSFDCRFEPFFGRGWIYKISRRDGDWTFAMQRRTWTT